MYFETENLAFNSDSSSFEDVGRVSNGLESKVGQFPHQLLLISTTGGPCGAVLITSILALTAAHCIQGPIARNPGQIEIQSGRQLISHDDKYVQTVRVKTVVIHEQYHYDKNLPQNDIALLLLEKELTFNAYTYMTYVPTNKTRFEDTALVSGWGRTSEKGKFSDALKWVVLDLMSLHRCRELYKPINRVVADHMLCALGKSGEGPCKMDSGGPLTCKGLDGRHYVCGIVSWRDGCGPYPGVFTDVAKFSGWIKDKIEKYK